MKIRPYVAGLLFTVLFASLVLLGQAVGLWNCEGEGKMHDRPGQTDRFEEDEGSRFRNNDEKGEGPSSGNLLEDDEGEGPVQSEDGQGGAQDR